MIPIADGLAAAILLALGRADGLVRLVAVAGETRLAARRSFWAIAVALPGFLALHLMDWAVEGRPQHAGRLLAHDLAGYLIGWLGFAVLSHRLMRDFGRAALWPRFIAAWNWCSVVQYMLLVVAGLPPLLGLADWVGQTTWLVAIFWALWLEYFAARLTLQLTRVQAWAMVALDLALGLFISELISSLA
jgi:hypothetical protein